MVRRSARLVRRDRHRRRGAGGKAMGADFAYIGSPFIATPEARATDEYKQAIIEGGAADIVTSALFTGVSGNYLRASIVAAGLDPDDLPQPGPDAMNFQSAPAPRHGATSGDRARASAWSTRSRRRPS